MNKLLAGYFLIQWSISFSHDGGKSWELIQHAQKFDDQERLITFIRQSPAPGYEYECIESSRSRHGRCRMEGMRIANLYRIREKRSEEVQQ